TLGEGSVDRLSAKIVVETGHYDAVCVDDLDSILFRVLLGRIAFVFCRVVFQYTLCKFLTVALCSDPRLTCDAEAQWVLEDNSRMQVTHYKKFAAEQWR